LENLIFHEVDRERWDDLEKLFESRGGPKYCWCMVWRTTPEEARNRDGQSRKSALKRRVDGGIPVGILGYLDGKPIAWCSIAPRSTYRPLGGVDDPAEEVERVWSIVCFFIERSLRGQGIMKRLIAAAIDQAMRRGARVIEAYPVEAEAHSYRFMGFVPVFKAMGFQEVGRAGSRRHVMRLWLEQPNDTHGDPQAD
jgi:GNAT superfamily N-acetyltransferase